MFNMKTYKFSQLSKKAKKNAANEYLEGWEETHGKDDMSFDDAYSSCIDTEDEILYDIKGKCLEETEF